MRTHRLRAALLRAALLSSASFALAQTPTPEGLEDWALLLGDWSLVEQRYSFEGELIETHRGQARFGTLMDGQRIQETQWFGEGEERSQALHVFVFDPRSRELEIARTDSDHYGFSVLIGSVTPGLIDLLEKHPNPEHQVIRRVRYTKNDERSFLRTLEFSTDQGESWFIRSEWIYSRP